jgi:hypothetical protein
MVCQGTHMVEVEEVLLEFLLARPVVVMVLMVL